MDYLIRTANEDGEIEFYRTNDGGLLIDITQPHGNTYYILKEEEESRKKKGKMYLSSSTVYIHTQIKYIYRV